MKKFYVLHVANVAETVAHEFFDFSTVEEALEKYYALLAYDYNTSILPTLDGFVCEVLDGTGLPIERKAYTKPIVVPEIPEEE